MGTNRAEYEQCSADQSAKGGNTQHNGEKPAKVGNGDSYKQESANQSAGK